ncbi:MAG: tol-pal system-associated acyl-CoA thioesterase [marine bacterium B5-7]|nr:MAG: tol-pal system-associated acyl-CoA thioesterase [marine bacterium B5-7]
MLDETYTFRFAVRIYYEDTDAAGVVYYANYLKFTERARSEWLRSMDIELDELARNEGVLFPVRSLTARYDQPAQLGDLIDIHCRLDAIGVASMTLSQMVTRGDESLFHGTVKLACVDARTFRPKRLPSIVLNKLNSWKTQ